jgi:NTE family protein
MTVAASSLLFAVVFTLFVVAAVALLVLTLRFTIGQARRSRATWLAGRAGSAEAEVGGDGDGDGDGDDAEEEPEEEGMTALVLAGGSTRGAIQIGMLQVLAEHGFVPDRVYGSSVGAINGAGFAADPTRPGVERMAQIWLGLRREDIYPQGRLHGPWLYVQQRDAVYSNSGLREIITLGFPHERLEESVLPLEVVATSLADGGEHWFTRGPAVEAILASAAMPAIFPPVEVDGERYIDGGVVDNVPIQRAIDAGATRIVVLLCSPPIVTPQPSKRPVEGMVNALLIAIHARFVRDMSHLPEGVEVILCAGPEGATRDFDDFSTTEHLIALGRAEASEIVRRYGLGTIPYPAPPRAVPSAAAPGDDLPGGGGPGGATVPPTSPAPAPSPSPTGTDRPPGAGDGTDVGDHSPAPDPPDSPVSAASGPVTQPDPGT